MQKILSKAGVASRRTAEAMILAGRVTVNGEKILTLGQKFDGITCKIAVDGRPISAPEKHIYVLLNKPKGYVSTVKDERGRPTVLDLVKDIAARIYPVGRLDRNTEGLILMTNDGALMNALLHPKYATEKKYVAKVSGDVREERLDKLRIGVSLEDGITTPAKVRVLEREAEEARVEIILREGRNRQVRRMFAAIGCDVVSLKRVEFAGLNLQGVKRGQYRLLTKEEVAYLYRLTGTRA